MSPARRLNDRNPFEIYLLVVAVVTSVPVALGVAPKPGSILEQLPGWPAQIWATTLALGSLTALAGIAWKRPGWPLISVTGLLLERVGLFAAGAATTFYAVAVMLTAGRSALIPAGFMLAFGLASLAQARRIGTVVRTSRPTR